MISTLFLIVVGFLMILAAFDLFVGVSNDAVNFLNSAIGCKIAPMKHILIIASLGVLIGATFSSGMMDVARSGMFHPELFSFKDIAFIYFSVMVADVIMLKVFNYLGLPTSTTVSIIFELLGASVFAAGANLLSSGQNISEIINFIKLDKTATIVSAILLSVVISFIAGALVQFICRIFFSFKITNTYKYIGGLYSGFCISAILYFLVMKGAKGASFMKPEYIAYIQNNTVEILIITFIVITILSQLLIAAGFNIFKLIILSGTFALAFSFAGNDLVNFVGVPFAALDGYQFYSASSLDPEDVMMETLAGSAKTPTFMLLISGLIMVVTFFISRSALKVIQTSINLSSSSKGDKEQFGSSVIGRVITRVGISASKAIVAFMPSAVKNGIAQRYAPDRTEREVSVAFDYVRASVNLVVAAILISSATSLKLPLSTTYVTFMVAMGTSFADGVWDRESAVYRISGVVTVIAGWFLTGLCAFAFAFSVSLVVYLLKWFAVFGLMALVVFVMLRNIFIKGDEKVSEKRIKSNSTSIEIINAVSKAAPAYFEKSCALLHKSLDAFFADKEIKLKKVRNKSINLVDKIIENRSSYFDLALDNSEKASSDAKHFFYLANTNMIEAAKTVQQCISISYNHIANRHAIFGSPLSSKLYAILLDIEQLADRFKTDLMSRNSNVIMSLSENINKKISEAQVNLVQVISNKEISISSSDVYLNILQSMRDLSNRYVVVMLQEHAIINCINGNDPEKSLDVAMADPNINDGYISLNK